MKSLIFSGKIQDIQKTFSLFRKSLGYINIFYSFYQEFRIYQRWKILSIVFNNLKQCGYNLYIGKLDNLEIDFIAEKNNNRVYIHLLI